MNMNHFWSGADKKLSVHETYLNANSSTLNPTRAAVKWNPGLRGKKWATDRPRSMARSDVLLFIYIYLYLFIYIYTLTLRNSVASDNILMLQTPTDNFTKTVLLEENKRL